MGQVEKLLSTARELKLLGTQKHGSLTRVLSRLHPTAETTTSNPHPGAAGSRLSEGLGAGPIHSGTGNRFSGQSYFPSICFQISKERLESIMKREKQLKNSSGILTFLE